eukprot:364557-Chlamydomonas_euryale.AAC.26
MLMLIAKSLLQTCKGIGEPGRGACMGKHGHSLAAPSSAGGQVRWQSTLWKPDINTSTNHSRLKVVEHRASAAGIVGRQKTPTAPDSPEPVQSVACTLVRSPVARKEGLIEPDRAPKYILAMQEGKPCYLPSAKALQMPVSLQDRPWHLSQQIGTRVVVQARGLH